MATTYSRLLCPQAIVDLRLWVMSLAVKRLKVDYSKKLAAQLENCLTEFIKTLKRKGSAEDILSAERLLADMPKSNEDNMFPDYVGPVVLKSWLVDVALEELKHHPSKRKATTLKHWMEISKTALNSELETGRKYQFQMAQVIELMYR